MTLIGSVVFSGFIASAQVWLSFKQTAGCWNINRTEKTRAEVISQFTSQGKGWRHGTNWPLRPRGRPMTPAWPGNSSLARCEGGWFRSHADDKPHMFPHGGTHKSSSPCGHLPSVHQDCCSNPRRIISSMPRPFMCNGSQRPALPPPPPPPFRLLKSSPKPTSPRSRSVHHYRFLLQEEPDPFPCPLLYFI